MFQAIPASSKTISTSAIRLLAIGCFFILANGLSSIFVTVFLWKLSNDYVQVALYNLYVYLFMPAGFILAGLMTGKKGVSFCLRTGMAAMIVYFAFILNINTRASQFIFLLGFIYGIGYGFFYYSVNTLLFYYTSEDNRSYYLGLNNAFGSVMGIISPVISGFIIINKQELNGYYYVFSISLLLYVIAGIISFFLEDTERIGKFDIRKIISYKNKNWQYVLKSNLFLGFREGAIYFIIDILYFITFGNEFSFGGFTTLIAFVGVISAYLVGKYIRQELNRKYILIGGTVTLAATLVMVIHTSVPTVIAYGLLTSIFNCFWLIPVLFIHYQVAETTIRKEEYMGEYMISKEIPLAIGRILGILVFIVVELSSLNKIAVKISLPVLNAMVLLAFIFTLSRIKRPAVS
ncbi:MFS transporter [Flavitalea flava]